MSLAENAMACREHAEVFTLNCSESQVFSGRHRRSRNNRLMPRLNSRLVQFLAILMEMMIGGLVFATDLGLPGPYLVGQRTVTVTRASGSTFTAQIYYPATSAGTGKTFNPAAGPAPAISFGHGFLQTVSRYQSTLQHLATHGYIVIASESESGLFPSHANFASDLSRSLTYLEQQNITSSSFLFGMVDSKRFGMGGHSMGGGASLLAAASDVRVRTVAPEAPAETTPSAVAASGSLFVPLMIIAGDADSIVPTGTNGQLMYNATRTPRQLEVIHGGSHCGFIDSATLGCDAIALSRADQLQTTRRLLTAWFNLYLKQDQSPWPVIWGALAPIDSRVTQVSEPRMTVNGPGFGVQLIADTDATLEFSLRNTDEASAECDFFATDMAGESLPWPVTFIPAGSGLLASGATMRFIATISPSIGDATIVVSARQRADGATRAWTSVLATTVCRGDFNQDGGIDGTDVEAFFHAWSHGDQAADINFDGGVDGSDVGAFFAFWTNGQC
jgi:dienelactone hydrolase